MSSCTVNPRCDNCDIIMDRFSRDYLPLPPSPPRGSLPFAAPHGVLCPLPPHDDDALPDSRLQPIEEPKAEPGSDVRDLVARVSPPFALFFSFLFWLFLSYLYFCASICFSAERSLEAEIAESTPVFNPQTFGAEPAGEEESFSSSWEHPQQ